MCDRTKEMANFLNEHSLQTLFSTGINIDQCVTGTPRDAYLKGFDTILLRDGCATNSPSYAQWSVELNCLISSGFPSGCKGFAGGAGLEMHGFSNDEPAASSSRCCAA